MKLRFNEIIKWIIVSKCSPYKWDQMIFYLKMTACSFSLHKYDRHRIKEGQLSFTGRELNHWAS